MWLIFKWNGKTKILVKSRFDRCNMTMYGIMSLRCHFCHEKKILFVSINICEKLIQKLTSLFTHCSAVRCWSLWWISATCSSEITISPLVLPMTTKGHMAASFFWRWTVNLDVAEKSHETLLFSTISVAYYDEINNITHSKLYIYIYIRWFGLVFLKFYGISTFVGYLMPNPFSYKLTVLFQTIQFSIST